MHPRPDPYPSPKAPSAASQSPIDDPPRAAPRPASVLPNISAIAGVLALLSAAASVAVIAHANWIETHATGHDERMAAMSCDLLALPLLLLFAVSGFIGLATGIFTSTRTHDDPDIYPPIPSFLGLITSLLSLLTFALFLWWLYSQARPAPVR